MYIYLCSDVFNFSSILVRHFTARFNVLPAGLILSLSLFFNTRMSLLYDSAGTATVLC